MFQKDVIPSKTETNLQVNGIRKKITTADYLEWSQIVFLINQLKKEKDYSMLMVVALGSYLGLRYSDMVKLCWDDILVSNTLIIEEQKTKKVKRISINHELKTLAEWVFLNRKLNSPFTIINKTGKPVSIQYINRRLKEIRIDYRLKINNFSVHTFRKSFGRRVYENNFRSEHSLILLSDILNHSSIAITRRYLGLRQEEIADVYLNL